MNNIAPGTVRRLISYDPETGILTWLARKAEEFPRDWKRWNSIYAERPALNAVHKDGYRHGHLLNRAVLAHRVAWAIQTGNWPAGQIDHINGDRSDNRMANLRSVTADENARNQKVRSTNTSGTMGISWHRASKKWRVRIGVNGVRRQVGMFSNLDEAVAARQDAEAEAGYHENHNRRADSTHANSLVGSASRITTP